MMIKRSRVQRGRSRKGCHHCKSAHMKCDEKLPACSRCSRLNKTCLYDPIQFVDCSTLDRRPISRAVPSWESRAISHFVDRTTNQLGGSFPTDLWMRTIPQLVEVDPIVRQAVLALSGFHEWYVDGSVGGLPNNALQSCRKAQQGLIKLDSMEDNFQSIICACAIFSACESLIGSFDTSVSHVLAGMKIIATKKTSLRKSLTMEDQVLYSLFMTLQNQALEANVEGEDVSWPALDTYLAKVPTSFVNLDEALLYIQSISLEIVKLHERAQEHHNLHVWQPSVIDPALVDEYATIRDRHQACKKAVASLEIVHKGNQEKQQSLFLLKIFLSVQEIDLYVFKHGEEVYNACHKQILGILDKIDEFIRSSEGKSGSKSTIFTSTSGVVPFLFEIATRSGLPIIQTKATALLRSAKRREGIWDSDMAANLAEAINELAADGSRVAAELGPEYKFLITQIILVSPKQCNVEYGYKIRQPGSFNSYWLETIGEGEGMLQTETLDLG